jgi:hypothetical protein
MRFNFLRLGLAVLAVLLIAVSAVLLTPALLVSGSVASAQTGQSALWDLAGDFRIDGNAENPNRDRRGNRDVWRFFDQDNAVLHSPPYTLLQTFQPAALTVAGLEEWQGPAGTSPNKLPEVGKNATCCNQTVSTISWPKDTILVHPYVGGGHAVIVGFTSPYRSGLHHVDAVFSRRDTTSNGDGIQWFVDLGSLTGIAQSTMLDSGVLAPQPGASHTFCQDILLTKNKETIYFIVDANINLLYDSTGLSVQIYAKEHRPCLMAKVRTIRAIEGAQVTADATFTDQASSTASQYSATIDWGDGSPSSTVAPSGPTGGPFNVSGTHTYAEEGSYTVTVTITGPDEKTATATSTATVAAAPLDVTCPAFGLSSYPMSYTGNLVYFTHVNPLEPFGLDEFTAMINWGGTEVPLTSFGTVGGSPATGNYSVTGSHNFHTTGTHNITVTITDDGESTRHRCRLNITGKKEGPFIVHGSTGGSDPWLAGMPDATSDDPGSVAPDQSPVQVGPPASIILGQYLEFLNVNGTTNFDPFFPTYSSGCDGSTLFPSFSHFGGAKYRMSDLTAPANSLVGVFLGPTRPDLAIGPFPPPALDFSTDRDFETLSPLLQQPFFIGDGLTGDGVRQQFFIPAEATRLYLGTMDIRNWSDNDGQCRVGNVLASDP